MITIYDARLDYHREATQADVDRLVRTEKAFGVLRLAIQGLLEETLSAANGDDQPKPMLGAIRMFTD